MSLAYKVEELLALRDSVSESAVSLDRFADEDVIKEHVLRPSASASANLASRASNRSLRPPAVPAVVPALSQKRPSPSPSFKRGKAEKLLKEHGSPPGIRVTAGGRIVPSDLPPLGTSRFGDSIYKSQPLRVTPGNVMSAQPQSNGNGTARIEIIGGQPVVFVGDRMFALPAVNSTNSNAPVNDTTAIESAPKQTMDLSTLNNHGTLTEASFGPTRANTQSQFPAPDLPTLKAQQALKKQELRTVEQTEVLQASHQSEGWRASMIEKKRSLIVELDALRKQIATLETENATSSLTNPAGASSASVPPFAPHLQQPLAQGMYAFPTANPYTSMMMYPPPYSTFPGFSSGVEPVPFVPAPTNPPHSPGSASRRSHAIEIKPPHEEITKQLPSSLDPKSPTYEPGSTLPLTQGLLPPMPSPPKRSPWDFRDVAESSRHVHQASSQKPSLSSIDTTDFFPTNTHEYSSTRVPPRNDDVKVSSNENPAVPSTPEKNWPASPWNEGGSGRSRKNEPSSKLTSWPEAFGRVPSIPSLRQGAAAQPFAPPLERAPIMRTTPSTSALSNNILPRTNSDQRTGTEENWRLSSKATAHVPSTYQEGYQAGYDHVGIPDSPDVLQGYMQGLLHFLSDESKKRQAEATARDLYQRSIDSRTPSLRGLVAGSQPHDSAIGMTFNHNDTAGGKQENVRSATGNLHWDSAYSPQGGTRDAPVSYTRGHETVQQPRQRVVSNAKHLNPPGLFPDRMVSGHRHVAFPSNENDMVVGLQEKGIPSRADSFSSGANTRQSFGNPLQNRGYGTPLSMQRFYPSPTEMSPNKFGGDRAPSPRPFANHRLSGLDGAMDDLAELVGDARIEDVQPAATRRSYEVPLPVEVEESNASCFKPYSSKGKQKATSSPSKSATTGTGRDNTTASPANPPSSPKKSGEHSPAKVKLEQVTNKFRRVKKDDPRAMSPEDRMKRSDKWRNRFQQLKKVELDEIEAHRKNNRV